MMVNVLAFYGATECFYGSFGVGWERVGYTFAYDMDGCFALHCDYGV